MCGYDREITRTKTLVIMNNEKEIPFGAFDSELMHQEISIPEGFEATIDGNKIILTRIENEDEKIRKALIEYFNEQCDISDWNGVYGYQVVAWLEKQGEQKVVETVAPKLKVGDWYIDNEDGTIFQIVKVLDNTYTYKTNEGKEYSCTHYSLENDAKLWTIQDAKDGDVLCYKDEISLYKHDIKNCTKQETTFGGFVYHCCYDGKRFITDSLYSLTEQDKMDIHPATKEQRDILFAKIKEAGYEWDENNKMLKEIVEDEEEPQNYKNQIMSEITDLVEYYIKQKPTCGEAGEDMKEALRMEYEKGRADAFAEMQKEWSEEDECTLNGILDDYKSMCKTYRNWLESLKNRIQPQPKQEWSEEDEKIRQTIINEFEQCSEWYCSNGLTKEDCINWLKRQECFKWDDEDNENMNSLCVLLDQMVSINAIGNEHSIEYKNWLKSLKEKYTWKPSDEQINAFKQVYDWYNTHFAQSLSLNSLYYDLKKLTE